MAKQKAQSKKKRSAAALPPDTNTISTVSLYDRFNSVASGLTPVKLAKILRDADEGDISQLQDLFQEMVTRDADLFTPINSRKLAVTRLDYEVIAASDDPSDVGIRDYVASAIENIKNFNQSLSDLLDAVTRGLSACWIEWAFGNDGNLVVRELHHTSSRMFRYGRASDPKSNLNELRRLTDDNLFDGIDLEPNKWVIHQAKATSGYATQVQLMRMAVFLYIFRNFGWKAFMIFAEVFGMPIRIGKYPAGIGDDEQLNRLKAALRSIGVDSSGIIPDNMEIEFHEAQKTGGNDSVHVKLIELVSKTYAKAILGHTGTSESTPGKLGNESAAQDVKFELVEADAIALATTISDSLIKPWVDFQFGVQEKYPYFKFLITEPEDLSTTADYLKKAQDMGVAIPSAWARKKFGIPEPEEGEEILVPRQQTSTIPFESSIAKSLLGTKADLLK